MDCLSAEDLKEERNCSLTRERTLNPHTCPAARMAFANGVTSRLRSLTGFARFQFYACGSGRGLQRSEQTHG